MSNKLSPVFKNKFEFVYDYFSKALQRSGTSVFFPQSIIFEGLDIFAQLHFSLELARVLNCLKGGGENCDCINCRWIKEGKHPAVVLVSPIDFKNDDKGSKTVISLKQAHGITKTLEQTSDYHRVFILLDAKVQNLSEIDKANLANYVELGYALPSVDWLPAPLNHKIFQPAATNALLKAVEEPPGRTTFIFLTNNREDVIPTIVSRSLTFKMAALKPVVPTDFIEQNLHSYPNLNLLDAYELTTVMLNYLKENDCEAKTVLIMLEEYISRLLRTNYNNSVLVAKFKNDLKLITLAKRQLFASMLPKIVFESLFIGISNRSV